MARCSTSRGGGGVSRSASALGEEEKHLAPARRHRQSRSQRTPAQELRAHPERDGIASRQPRGHGSERPGLVIARGSQGESRPNRRLPDGSARTASTLCAANGLRDAAGGRTLTSAGECENSREFSGTDADQEEQMNFIGVDLRKSAVGLLSASGRKTLRGPSFTMELA